MFLQLLTGLSLLEIVLGAGCDQDFTGSFGVVTSPEYFTRSSYANNQYCQYDIKVDFGRQIKLTWSKFDIKGKMPYCTNDYVEIYIGCSRHSIGKYCSDNSYTPHDIYSPDNCLRIKFRSDSSGSGGGFSASYSTISSSGSSLYSDCYSKSGKTLYGNSGIVSTYKWPNDYSSLKDCYWKLDVGSNKNVKIAFMDLDLESDLGCDDDKVKIKGGRDYQSYDSSSTIKSSMCGTKSAFYFTSTKERIWIRFKSDSFRSGRGFVAGYVLYDSTSSSSGSSKSSSSVVAGVVVTIIVLLVFAGCIYYVFVYRRRLAMRHAAQPHAMTAQVHAPPPQAVVHHPPPPSQPGYGPPPPAGYAPPPQPGYAPPPQPGYAPPPYSQAVAAPYPQQEKPGQYPPAPQGGAPPYPPEQPGGAPPYPPGQPGGAPPYPPGQPGETAPYPPAGAPPYPTAPPGGTAPYPSAPPAGAPYPPK